MKPWSDGFDGSVNLDESEFGKACEIVEINVLLWITKIFGNYYVLTQDVVPAGFGTRFFDPVHPRLSIPWTSLFVLFKRITFQEFLPKMLLV